MAVEYIDYLARAEMSAEEFKKSRYKLAVDVSFKIKHMYKWSHRKYGQSHSTVVENWWPTSWWRSVLPKRLTVHLNHGMTSYYLWVASWIMVSAREIRLSQTYCPIRSYAELKFAELWLTSLRISYQDGTPHSRPFEGGVLLLHAQSETTSVRAANTAPAPSRVRGVWYDKTGSAFAQISRHGGGRSFCIWRRYDPLMAADVRLP